MIRRGHWLFAAMLATACGGVPDRSVTAAAPKCATASPPGVWTAIPSQGAPAWRSGDSVVATWTGTHALLAAVSFGERAAMSFFEPCSGRWQPVSMSGAPEAVAAVDWIGGRLFAWDVGSEPRANIYDATRSRWTRHSLPLSARGAPQLGPRVVLFGEDADRRTDYAKGRILNPTSGDSQIVLPAGAPSARVLAGWTLLEDRHALFVFGGGDRRERSAPSSGGMLDVVTGRWTPLPEQGAPSPRYKPAVVSNDTEVVVWGGFDLEDNEPLADGARFVIGEDRWRAMSASGGQSEHHARVALTNRFFLVVGGEGGARYDLAADRWTSFEPPMPILDAGARLQVLHDDTVLFHERKGAWFWRFDPQALTWSNIPRPSDARREPAILVGGDHLFIWGGTTLVERPRACDEGAACAPTQAREVLRTDGAMLRL